MRGHPERARRWSSRTSVSLLALCSPCSRITHIVRAGQENGALSALLNRSAALLSPEDHALLFSPQLDSTGKALGVGWAFRQGRLGEESYFSKPGGGPGFSSNVRIYRELGIATVFLSNRMRISEASIEQLSDQLDAPFVAQGLGGPPSSR